MAEAFGQFQYPTPPLGTSDSGFRAEVEAEQSMQRGEHLLALTTDHQHDLRGPAAHEAAARLADFHQRTGFTGSVVTHPARLRRVLARHDPEVYPGTYVTCVFNPDKALCRPRSAPEAERVQSPTTANRWNATTSR
ncbi:hypothetical protein [Streptomyces sp. NPDC002054]|uniref:hypothetical protein n=1 Tax=Streptomyces sp. NPDC002054 TaxID=3154663 RepID=UPI00331C3589